MSSLLRAKKGQFTPKFRLHNICTDRTRNRLLRSKRRYHIHLMHLDLGHDLGRWCDGIPSKSRAHSRHIA